MQRKKELVHIIYGLTRDIITMSARINIDTSDASYIKTLINDLQTLKELKEEYNNLK